MLGPKLVTQVAHNLVMTKQLQQSLKILQIDSMELRDYLISQIEENPFIQLPHDYPCSTRESLGNTRYENVTTKEGTNPYSEEYISKLATVNITLKDHLITQISTIIHDDKEKLIALRCTDSLDSNGYLREPFHEIATSLKCEVSTVERVLQKLYTLDPCGVYAQNLQECLTLQIKERNIYDNIFENILQNLTLISKGELAKLAKHCSISLDELTQKIALTKSLHPKPGQHFFTEPAQTLIPDVYVYFTSTSEIAASINNQYLQNIEIDNDLYQNSIENLKNKEEIEFCRHKFNHAKFIARALEQRTRTILQVATAIAQEQYEFFEKGVNYLKPMVLSNIAKKAGVHESTVSRISNKVIASPIGSFEVKYFFNSSIKSNITENLFSSTSIKYQIKEVIANEECDHILADDKISALLQSKGIDISRRTVTKYREMMRIPSSHERKRLKAVNQSIK